MKNFASRILVAAALALVPAAAFADTTPVPPHDHTPVVRSHTPTVHDRSVSARH